MKIYILILILILLGFVIKKFFKVYIEPMDNLYGKISVIILNYNRPHNLVESLPILNKYKLIDEIIVLHGDPNFYKDFKYDKVKNIKDFKNNEIYGSSRRFLHSNLVKNNIILFLDDDTLPEEKYVNDIYLKLTSNYKKNTIYGSYRRQCNSSGYNFKSENYDTILTAGLMCKKEIIEIYREKYFDKFKDWFIKYKGNCEDLSLNVFINKYYNEKPQFVSGKIKELDTSNGHSSNSNHNTLRNNFCKKYS